MSEGAARKVRWVRRLAWGALIALVLATAAGVGCLQWFRAALPGLVNARLEGRASWTGMELRPGRLVLREARLWDGAGQPVLSAAEIRVAFGMGTLLRTRSVPESIEEITVERPHLDLVVNGSGTLNVASLFRPSGTPLSTDRLRGVLTVRDGEVFYRDTRGSGFLVPFQRVRGQVDMRGTNGGAGELAGSEAGQDGASVRVQATWGRNLTDPRATVRVERVGVPTWAGYALERLGSRIPPSARVSLHRGRARARLLVQASGAPANWLHGADITGSVEVEGLDGRSVAFPVALQGGRGTALVTRDLVAVKRFEGLLNGERFTLAGRVFHFSQPQVDATVQARTGGLRSALARLGVRARVPVDGEASAELQLAGSLHEPSVRGRVESRRLEVAGHVVRDLRVDFARQHGMVRVEKAVARAEGGSVKVSGWASLEPQGGLMLRVETQDALLRGFLGDALGAPARGTVDLNVLARGKGSPLVFGRGRLADAQVSGVKIAEAEGSFALAGGTVLLGDVRARTSLGQVQAPTALVELDGRKRIFAQAQARGVNCDISGARVSGADVDVQVMGTMHDVEGMAHIRQGSVQRGGLSLGRLSGTVAFDSRTVVVPGVEFDLQGMPMWGAGGMSLQGDHAFELALGSPSADAARALAGIAPNLHLPGVLSGRGPLSLVAAGDAQQVFWGLDWRVPWGDLRAEGFAGLGRGSLGGVVVANAVDASLLAHFGMRPLHPTGRVSLAGIFGTRPTGGWSFDLSASSPDLSVVGMPVRSVGARGVISGHRTFLDFLAANGPAGSLRFQGQAPFGSGAWRGAWWIDDADLSVVGRQLKAGPEPARVLEIFRRAGLDTMHGRGVAWGRVDGPVGKVAFRGTLRVDQAVLHNRSLVAYVPFAVQAGRVSVDEGVVGLDGDQMLGSGWVNVVRPHHLDLRLSTRRFEIPQLLEFTAWPAAARRGWVDGSLRLIGPWDRMVSAAGKMRLHDAVVAGQPIEEAHAVLEARPGAVVLKDLRALIGGAVVEGGGVIRERGPLDVTLSAKDIALENLVTLRRNTTLRGRGSLGVRVEGTLAHPRVASSFDLHGVGLGAKSLVGVQGGLEWSERTVLLKDVRLLQNDKGRGVALSGEVQLGESATLPESFAGLLRGDSAHGARVALSLQFSDTDIAVLSDLLDLDGGGLRGFVDGTAEIKGRLAEPRVSTDLRARSLAMGPLEAGSGSLVLDWDGPAHHLLRLAASVEGKAGSLSVADASGATGRSVTLRAHDFNLALVRPFLPWSVPLSGALTADLELSGDALNPDVHGKFRVLQGGVSGLSFDSFSGAVRGKGGVYHLDDWVLAKSTHRAFLSGEIPVRREPGGGFSFPAPLQLSGRVSEHNLDILSLFIPDMLPSKGRLQGRFVATGVYPDIRYTAEFGIHDGTFRHSRLALPVDNLQLAVRVVDQRLEVQQGSGTLGKGSFVLSGGANVRGVGLEDIDLRLEGQNLAVGVAPYLDSTLDANLHLSGTLAAPRLAGRIETRGARLHLPLEGLSAAGPGLGKPAAHPLPKASPLEVDVRVDLGRGAWLTFLNSAVRAEGGLRIRGRWPQVTPEGSVALKSGQIQVPLFPVSFRVASGRALFKHETGWMPRLAATAVTRSGGYDVYVDVRGNAGDPTVRMTSNPPLSQAAIQQLLMGGTPYNPTTMGLQGATGSLGTAALVGIAEATFLQPVTSALRSFFQLSEVTLEFVQTGGVQFRVSKALDTLQRFFLTFSSLQGNNQQNLPRNVYGFEYRFSPYQLVRISSDDTGGLNFYYQARMRF